MKLTPNQEILRSDIMRYKTNKLPASLALLGIVFGCLYFCLLYGYKTAYFSMWQIGISVILTLIVLLATFLASEGIKSYKKNYSYVLLVLAAVQIIRMFGLPFEALRHDMNLPAGDVRALDVRYFGADLSSTASYVILVIWLAASAACLLAAAIIGYINCVKLEKFQKEVESGAVDVDKVLADMDAEDAAAQAANENAGGAVSAANTETVSASEEEGE